MRADGHFGPGADVPADEPFRRLWHACRRGRRHPDFCAAGPEELPGGQEGAQQRLHPECDGRRHLRDGRPVFPRSDSSLFRRQRCYAALCAELYDPDSAGQRHHASLFRPELHRPRVGPSAEGDVRHHPDGDAQYDPRPDLHLRLQDGHPGRGHRHGHFSVRILCVDHAHHLRQARVPASVA